MKKSEVLEINSWIQQDIQKEKNKMLYNVVFFGLIAAIIFCIHMFILPTTGYYPIKIFTSCAAFCTTAISILYAYGCAFGTSKYFKDRIKKLNELSPQNIEKEEAIEQIYAIKGIELVWKNGNLIGIRTS